MLVSEILSRERKTLLMLVCMAGVFKTSVFLFSCVSFFEMACFVVLLTLNVSDFPINELV